jgi:hypothetical protein
MHAANWLDWFLTIWLWIGVVGMIWASRIARREISRNSKRLEKCKSHLAEAQKLKYETRILYDEAKSLVASTYEKAN